MTKDQLIYVLSILPRGIESVETIQMASGKNHDMKLTMFDKTLNSKVIISRYDIVIDYVNELLILKAKYPENHLMSIYNNDGDTYIPFDMIEMLRTFASNPNLEPKIK